MTIFICFFFSSEMDDTSMIISHVGVVEDPSMGINHVGAVEDTSMVIGHVGSIEDEPFNFCNVN